MASSTAKVSELWDSTTGFQIVADIDRPLVRQFVSSAVSTDLTMDSCVGIPTVGDDGADSTALLPYIATAFAAVWSKHAGDDAIIGLGHVAVPYLSPFSDKSKTFGDAVASCAEFIDANPITTNNDAELLFPAAIQQKSHIGFSAVVRSIALESGPNRRIPSCFDFVLGYGATTDGDLRLTLSYNASIYVNVTAQRVLDMVVMVLKTWDLPQKNIRSLTLLTEECTRKMLHEWQPDMFPIDTRLLHQVFSDVAKQYPNRCAVNDPTNSGGPRRRTYKELDELSSKLATYMQAKWKVEAGSVVGIYMNRCGDFYVAMLAILKAGGAYLSLDPEFPANRLTYALEDSEAIGLITHKRLNGQLEFTGPALELDTILAEVTATTPNVTDIANEHSATYLIYTSGSTGKPKGVIIEHQNIVNFVMSERKLFELSEKNVVIQGFSTSFDASLEEIWLAFASGSELVVAEKRVMQDTEALAELIMSEKVTVLSTVPTLLATMEPTAVANVTLLIVGGEACNKEVITTYATGPPRNFVNSYGPTEATVACTADFCNPDRPVTIGQAQPNYFALIVDDALDIAPPGTPGELCIAGPSVARGYCKRPDLTAEKFVASPHTAHLPGFERMYRTGDLVRWTLDGRIEFMGRIDSQVKLRGFRIEVSEIEFNIGTFPGVQTAVVILRDDSPMGPYLAAYVMCDDSLLEKFQEHAFREHLKASLPPYMIPSRFVPLDEMPRSPTGKLDRKALPPPPPLGQGDDNEAREIVEPSTETERTLHAVWSRHFPGYTVSCTDDFFEIGGHSLLAGKVASEIRKNHHPSFNIRDMYTFPRIVDLAQHLDHTDSTGNEGLTSSLLPPRQDPSWLRRTMLMIGHILTIHFIFLLWMLLGITGVVLYLEFRAVLPQSVPLAAQIAIDAALIPLAFSAQVTVYILIVLPLVKWTLIGRFEESVHSVWSFYYLRWWTVRTMLLLVPFSFLQGTFFINLFLRLMGARIGRGVYFCGPKAMDFDLLEIGDDCAIMPESALLTSEVVDSMLVLRRVVIGNNSSVGVRACVRGGSFIGDNVILRHLAMVPENSNVPDNEIWAGSPAKRIATTPAEWHVPVRPGMAFECALAVMMALFFYILMVLLMVPSVTLYAGTYATIFTLRDHFMTLQPALGRPAAGFIALIPMIGIIPCYVAVWYVLLHVCVLLLRYIVLPWHVKPGVYLCNSLMYHRKFMFDATFRMSLILAHPMYASIFTQYFLRALGCKIGHRVECSNLFGFTPGLTTLNSECFVADFVGVNPPELHHGTMNLGHVEVGRRSFIGNGSVLPPGTLSHDETLLGLLSVPKDEALTLEHGRSYIGSPAFAIPRGRTNVDAAAANRLFNPPARLYAARITWETFRAVTPTSLMVLNFFILWMSVVAVYPDQAIYSKNHVGRTAVVGNITPWLFSLLSLLEIILLKKIIVGTHKAESNPLWSHGVWRAEFIVDLVTTLGGPALLNYCRGTPLLPVVFRLLGAKIGTGCFIDTIHLTEPDMVTLGDHVSIGDRVTVQTHLFEDRVMKTSYLNIADRCSIGPNSIILYDTIMEKGCSVGALSLVMKGESYPAGSHWEGAPAERRRIPAIMVIPTPHPSMRPPSGGPRSGGPRSGGPRSGGPRSLQIQSGTGTSETSRLLAK